MEKKQEEKRDDPELEERITRLVVEVKNLPQGSRVQREKLELLHKMAKKYLIMTGQYYRFPEMTGRQLEDEDYSGL